jgi:hypothetical protein
MSANATTELRRSARNRAKQIGVDKGRAETAAEYEEREALVPDRQLVVDHFDISETRQGGAMKDLFTGLQGVVASVKNKQTKSLLQQLLDQAQHDVQTEELRPDITDGERQRAMLVGRDVRKTKTQMNRKELTEAFGENEMVVEMANRKRKRTERFERKDKLANYDTLESQLETKTARIATLEAFITSKGLAVPAQ